MHIFIVLDFCEPNSLEQTNGSAMLELTRIVWIMLTPYSLPAFVLVAIMTFSQVHHELYLSLASSASITNLRLKRA